MKDWVVSRRLLFSVKGELERKELTIRIGRPYFDDNGMARCPMEWDGLFDTYADMCSDDLLHALQIAVDVDSMLTKLTNKYEFFWPTGEPYFDG